MEKKITAIDVKGKAIEYMVDALLEMIEKNEVNWTKGWSTSNGTYRNYVNNKPYRGGSNLFTLWLSTIISPTILGEVRSKYYITQKQAFDLGWKLKDEVKSWSKDNQERREKIDKLKNKLVSLKDEEKIKEIKGEIKELNKEIYKHKIWEEIIYFNFTIYQIVSKDDKWYRQDLVYDKKLKDYKVVREKEVDEEYAKKHSDAIDKPKKGISTRFYTIAPIEYFKGEKTIKGRKTKPESFETKKTSEVWNILYKYFDREGINVNEERSNEAFYDIVSDSITLPEISQFVNEKEALATTAHEASHSTGAKDRLNRKYGTYGTPEYAKEELVAEIGSLFFMQEQGMLDEQILGKTLSYLKSYLNFIKDGNQKNNLIYGINNGKKAYDFISNNGDYQDEEDDDLDESDLD